MDYTNKSNTNVRNDNVKVTAVAQGGVKIKKETIADKIGKAFVKGAKYTWAELLVPAGKKMISEAGKLLWDSIIYGDQAPSNRPQTNGVPYVSYNRIYNNNPAPAPTRPTYNGAELFDISNVTFGPWQDKDGRNHSGKETAEAVLNGLYDIVMSYGLAKVADFYELAGVSTMGNYQVNKFCWTSLQTAQIQRVPGTVDEYYITLPKPMPID